MFSTEIMVTVEHINYGGHVGVDAYSSISQEARIRWLNLNSMSEVNLGENIGYVITGLSMRYKSQTLHGDVLIVEVACGNLQKKTVDFTYKMYNKSSGKMVALGETTHAFFDLKRNKISTPPKAFIEKFIVREPNELL